MTTVRQQTAANRKRILAREALLARQMAAHYLAVQRHLKAAQAALIAAYAAEQQRLADAAVDDEGEPLYPPPPVPISWLHDSGQWQRYTRVLVPAIIGFALASRMAITDGQRQAMRAGMLDAEAQVTAALRPILLRAGLSVDVVAHKASSTALEALIGRSIAADKPLSALLDGLGTYTADKTLKALYAALASGSHPTVAARVIADTTGMAYRRALTISRTEMITAYRTASVNTFRANSGVIDGWVWQAAADACPFCASMDGTFHTLDEYLDSHPNCRCTPRPQTKSLDDILAQFAA